MIKIQECHKDNTASDTDLLIWNRAASWTGISTNILNDRDPKFTSEIWKNLYQLFGKSLSFSIAYHPIPDGLAERMIKNLEDMVISLFSYGLELKDCDGFTHDWFTLLPSLKVAYKTSTNASTNQTPALLENRFNHRLSQNYLRKDLVKIHPTASSFRVALGKARVHAVR
ncbi:hypothetical protein O181_062950 [Austropuccinia psidii MF-1]|uniref:Integrase catalytic domain-containing protein n=1 Tax=Austropuccinia psidii MF-1 TaxID=1389203 RepID=A0A9Q3EQB2_9BASI|nr:hypothetical protein [Austropuccinia psidii MF-1]